MRRIACFIAVSLLALVTITVPAAHSVQEKVTLVVLGDSLTAGYGLASEDAFPTRLGVALEESGAAVEIINAGVSGDTSTGGLARLDWALPPDTGAVIVELGANDALRGIDPEETRRSLSAILEELARREIPVLLTGMRAPPNMGTEYAEAFDPIFAELAAEHDVLFYPFFLEGVAAELDLNQADGIHPNPAGVERIVQGILPHVVDLIDLAHELNGS